MTRHIGLREAVAEAVTNFCDTDSIYREFETNDERYRAFFRAVEKRLGFAGLLYNTRQEAAGTTLYAGLIKNWRTAPPSNKFQSMGDRTRALMVFYYFLYVHFNIDAKGKHVPDHSIGSWIDKRLDNSGELLARRKSEHGKTNPLKSTPKSISVSAKLRPIEKLTELADDAGTSAESSNPLTASQIDEDVYRIYPNDKIWEQYDSAISQEIDEKFFSRQEWTSGMTDADPEGIVSSLITNGEFGLRMTDQDRARAKRLFGKPTVRYQLPHLQSGYNGFVTSAIFSHPNPANNEISFELSKFDEPSEEFLQLALAAIGNAGKLRNLEGMVVDQLTFAIFKCISYHASGSYLELCSFFFEHISLVHRFSDYTRGLAAYLKAKYDTERGAAAEVYKSCASADEALASHFRATHVHPADHNLMSEIAAQETSNLITTTSLSNLNLDRVSRILAALEMAKQRVGLNRDHLESPDKLAKIIRRNPKVASSKYIPAVIHYQCEIMKCIVENNDATEFFRRHLIINEAIAESHPRTACVVLTPIYALAMHANLPVVARQIYKWRHDGHPNDLVNQERDKVDSLASFGVEPAIDLLTTYFSTKILAKHGDEDARERMEITKRKLIQLEAKYEKVSLKTVARYYARFKADISDDKKSYLVSESHDAESHHLYFGPIEDQYVQG